MLTIMRNDSSQSTDGGICARLRMATVIRLQIFAQQVVNPAMETRLAELNEGLARVVSRRHAVDFEVAKAWHRWQQEARPALIQKALQVLAADQELGSLRDEIGVEPAVYERAAGELAGLEIDRHEPLLRRRIEALRDERLNLQ